MNETLSNTNMRTRRAIKAAFTRLLESRGFSAVSVRDILSEANISRSTFYRYFEDKYVLTREIVADYMQDIDALADALLNKREKALPLLASRLLRQNALFCTLDRLPSPDFSLRNEFLLLVLRKLRPQTLHGSKDGMLYYLASMLYNFAAFVSEKTFRPGEELPMLPLRLLMNDFDAVAREIGGRSAQPLRMNG